MCIRDRTFTVFYLVEKIHVTEILIRYALIYGYVMLAVFIKVRSISRHSFFKCGGEDHRRADRCRGIWHRVLLRRHASEYQPRPRLRVLSLIHISHRPLPPVEILPGQGRHQACKRQRDRRRTLLRRPYGCLLYTSPAHVATKAPAMCREWLSAFRL